MLKKKNSTVLFFSFMRFIFLLSIFFHTFASASVYFSETDRDEGLERGNQPQFQAIGQVFFCGEQTYTSVGTLISPTKILTTSHIIEHLPKDTFTVFSLPALNNKEKPALLEVDTKNIIVHPDRALKETHITVHDTYGHKEQTWDAKFRALPTPDFAILTLKNPVPCIDSFPKLLLDAPRQAFSNGYVVSTYPSSIFQQRSIMASATSPQRTHVGIMKIAQDPSTHFLFTGFDLPYYQHGFPKLSVLTQQGDSGAPLIIKQGGVLKIAGLCSGGSYIPGNHFRGEHSIFTPLYPYGDWIRNELGS